MYQKIVFIGKLRALSTVIEAKLFIQEPFNPIPACLHWWTHGTRLWWMVSLTMFVAEFLTSFVFFQVIHHRRLRNLEFYANISALKINHLGLICTEISCEKLCYCSDGYGEWWRMKLTGRSSRLRPVPSLRWDGRKSGLDLYCYCGETGGKVDS